MSIRKQGSWVRGQNKPRSSPLNGSVASADLLFSSYKSKIDTFKDQFRKALDIFEGKLRMDQYQLVAGIGQSLSRWQSAPRHQFFAAQDTALQKLGAVDSAYWKSGAGCLEGTRTGLLEMIIAWAHGIWHVPPGMSEEEYGFMCSRNIFWLYGLAGAGKSTVANTVAKSLTLDGLYLACYFPARDGSESTPANKVFPTIAHRLALLYPPYREALMTQLGGPNSSAALNDDLQDQRKYLLEDLLSVNGVVPFQPIVVVIDGLDNCGSDPASQTALARNLVALASSLPWITSGNQP